MEEIIVKHSNSTNYKYVVFSISTESPLFFIDKIKNKISLEDGQLVIDHCLHFRGQVSLKAAVFQLFQ